MEGNNAAMRATLNLFRFLVPLIGGAWLAGGCAHKPVTPPSGAPPAPPAPVSAPAVGAPSAEVNWAEAAVAKPALPYEGEGWRALFNGYDLAGWRETPFAGHGEVAVESGLLVLNMGDPFTGVNLTNAFPNIDYEIALDAMRVMGSDIFCGLTVPVGTNHCSLIVGGWGGGVVGISSLDGMDASENDTTKYRHFEKDRWYRLRLRVTEGRLEAWVDSEKMVDVQLEGRKVTVRSGEIERSIPFGIASWQTKSALRGIQWRPVMEAADPPRKRR